MTMLAERRIPLEVCPTSNLRTGALGKLRGDSSVSLREHPIAQLFRAGIPITLSTDDPAMFQTDLLTEYEAAADAGLSVQELAKIAVTGFEHAFLPDADRKLLIARFDQALRK